MIIVGGKFAALNYALAVWRKRHGGNTKMSFNNEPTFPKTGNYGEHSESQFDSKDQNGMTLRDYFISHAPECPNENIWEHSIPKSQHIFQGERELKRVISWRIAYADAMLAAREVR